MHELISIYNQFTSVLKVSDMDPNQASHKLQSLKQPAFSSTKMRTRLSPLLIRRAPAPLNNNNLAHAILFYLEGCLHMLYCVVLSHLLEGRKQMYGTFNKINKCQGRHLPLS